MYKNSTVWEAPFTMDLENVQVASCFVRFLPKSACIACVSMRSLKLEHCGEYRTAGFDPGNVGPN